MKNILLILLLLSLSGCQPGKESQTFSIALREVEHMIEKDSFPNKYIILYETVSNDIGSIYKITSSNIPFKEGSLERPEKVIKYKNRYICFINPMASTDISREELLKITDYENDTVGTICEKMWYIGVSKSEKKQTLVSTHRTYLSSRFYTFPQLLKYSFEEYDEMHSPRFILGSYFFVVDTLYVPKEPLGNYIQRIEGEVYYTNVLDEYFKGKKGASKTFFAILNGKDTLRLNITDTIMQHLWFESDDNPAFFKSLPKNTWNELYALFRDSTFYFHEEKGKHLRYSVPYSDCFWLFEIKDTSGESIDDVYKKGVNSEIKEYQYSYDKWISN